MQKKAPESGTDSGASSVTRDGVSAPSVRGYSLPSPSDSSYGAS